MEKNKEQKPQRYKRYQDVEWDLIKDNFKLYQDTLRELLRVVKQGGNLGLITQDIKNLELVIKSLNLKVIDILLKNKIVSVSEVKELETNKKIIDIKDLDTVISKYEG